MRDLNRAAASGRRQTAADHAPDELRAVAVDAEVSQKHGARQGPGNVQECRQTLIVRKMPVIAEDAPNQWPRAAAGLLQPDVMIALKDEMGDAGNGICDVIRHMPEVSQDGDVLFAVTDAEANRAVCIVRLANGTDRQSANWQRPAWRDFATQFSRQVARQVAIPDLPERALCIHWDTMLGSKRMPQAERPHVICVLMRDEQAGDGRWDDTDFSEERLEPSESDAAVDHDCGAVATPDEERIPVDAGG